MIMPAIGKWRKRIYSFLFLLSLFGCICVVYGYCEARRIVFKEFTFKHEDIPPSFVGKKIIFIADIHCNRFFDKERVAALVKTVNERHPDIILMGGDYIESDTIYQQQFFEEIAKLKSQDGIYAVLGNHDHWADAPLVWQKFEKMGINICDNYSYWIRTADDSIKIGGVGDLWENTQIIENTIADISNKDFCILLSHNPEYLDRLDTQVVDLVLSGHNHGGQVTLFGLWAPVLPNTMHHSWFDTEQKYRYGWASKNDISMYITSGIGMGSIPFRFFSPPEIVELTLEE